MVFGLSPFPLSFVVSSAVCHVSLPVSSFTHRATQRLEGRVHGFDGGAAVGRGAEEQEQGEKDRHVCEKEDAGFVETVEMGQAEGALEEAMKSFDLPALPVGRQEFLGAGRELIADQNEVRAIGQDGNDQSDLRLLLALRPAEFGHAVVENRCAERRRARRTTGLDHPVFEVLFVDAQDKMDLLLEPLANQRDRPKPPIHKVDRPSRLQGDVGDRLRVVPRPRYDLEDSDRIGSARRPNAKSPQYRSANARSGDGSAAVAPRRGQRQRHGIDGDQLAAFHLLVVAQAVQQRPNQAQGRSAFDRVRQRALARSPQRPTVTDSQALQTGRRRDKSHQDRANQSDGMDQPLVVSRLDLRPQPAAEPQGGKTAGIVPGVRAACASVRVSWEVLLQREREWDLSRNNLQSHSTMELFYFQQCTFDANH
jgi:hypothetical protein